MLPGGSEQGSDTPQHLGHATTLTNAHPHQREGKQHPQHQHLLHLRLGQGSRNRPVPQVPPCASASYHPAAHPSNRLAQQNTPREIKKHHCPTPTRLRAVCCNRPGSSTAAQPAPTQEAEKGTRSITQDGSARPLSATTDHYSGCSPSTGDDHTQPRGLTKPKTSSSLCSRKTWLLPAL